jgi:hypothetical protein
MSELEKRLFDELFEAIEVTGDKREDSTCTSWYKESKYGFWYATYWREAGVKSIQMPNFETLVLSSGGKELFVIKGD